MLPTVWFRLDPYAKAYHTTNMNEQDMRNEIMSHDILLFRRESDVMDDMPLQSSKTGIANSNILSNSATKNTYGSYELSSSWQWDSTTKVDESSIGISHSVEWTPELVAGRTTAISR